jgi:hypothetical protein
MRRLLPIALALTVAACSSTPRPEPSVVKPVAPTVRETGQLIGLGENDLIARFGRPTFQVREGVGVKWQWANAGCVLDAYLYPGNSSALRVTHVDARRPNGSDMDSNACAVTLTR